MLKNEKEQLSIPLLEIIQAAQQGSVVHREGPQDLQRVHLAGVHFQQIRGAPGAPGLGYNIYILLATDFEQFCLCLSNLINSAPSFLLCNFHFQLAMFDRAAFAKAEYLKWWLWL